MITLRTHTDAVLTALEATGLTVGDADATEGDADRTALVPPYCVLYPRPEGRFSGTLARPTMKSELVYQVSCVGETREQSEWVADKALTILDGLQITDRLVSRAHPEGAPGTFRDDDADPRLFMTPVLFRITTT